MSTAAANSLMILNTAGLVFDSCDFSSAKLGCNTAAGGSSGGNAVLDLSGSVLSNCNFPRAQLQGARFSCADIHNTKFHAANMALCNFGETHPIPGGSGAVIAITNTLDAKYILVGFLQDPRLVMYVRGWDIC